MKRNFATFIDQFKASYHPNKNIERLYPSCEITTHVKNPLGHPIVQVNVSSSKEPLPSKDYEHGLSEEQLDAFQNITKERKSTLILGSAGSGKSYLIDRIREYCEDHKIVYAVTASTGNSAIGIKGTTINTFCGIGIANEPLDVLKKRWLDPNNRGCYFKFHYIWKDMQLLILDEVSMINPDFLSKLNVLVSAIRKRWNEPFGGVQLVILGDFLQLPAITNHRSAYRLCFELDEFPGFFQHVTFLKKIYRQNDAMFAEMLNRVRLGSPSSEDHILLRSRVKPFSMVAHTCPTRIVSRLDQAKTINDLELGKLDTPIHEFQSYFGYKTFEQYAMEKRALIQFKKRVVNKLTAKDEERCQHLQSNLKKNCPVDEKVQLKVGAKVLLVVNINIARGLVNGSRGTIVRFESILDTKIPIVEFENGITTEIGFHEWMNEDKSSHGYVTYAQIPLKLAYAITIHKSQSMSISNVHISLSGIFENGQAYVALSRATCLEGLHLDTYHPKCIKCDSDVLEFETHLREALCMGLQGKQALEFKKKKVICLF